MDDATVRRLTPNDVPMAALVGAEAFGDPPPGAPDPTSLPFPLPGRHQWGAFVGDELAATMTEREFGSWWGGQEVPTCGIASVAVRAERRGSGLLAPMLRAVLADAAARGQVLATLFATAPGIYRPAGFELVTDLTSVELDTRDLRGVRPPGGGVRVRRATRADVPTVRAAWDRWAAAQNGPLTRRGPSFTASDGDLLRAVTGITLAVVDRDGQEVVAGYVSWRRGSGYDVEACLEVDDLVAFSADAYRALWRVLGSFESVAPRVRLRSSGEDAARLHLPSERWPVVARHPYLVRMLDVAAALRVLPPTSAESTVELVVAGDRVAGTDGGYRVTRGPAGTSVERTAASPDGPTLTPGGLALLWSGAQTAANLRWSGHLAGPPDTDAALDDLALRAPLHVRNYF